MGSKQKRKELKKLARDHRSGLYQMLKLTDELLSDPAYIDEYGGEDALIEELEADEFAHFGGSPKLQQMVQAYRQNPKLATWDKYQHNIWAMIDLAKPSNPNAEAKERTNWKAIAQEYEARIDSLEASLRESQEVNRHLESRVEELLQEVGELRGELKYLNGRKGVAA